MAALFIPGFPYFLLVRGPLIFLLGGLIVNSLASLRLVNEVVIDLVIVPAAFAGLYLGMLQMIVVPIAVYRAKLAGQLARLEVQLSVCCGVGFYFVTAFVHTIH